MRAMPHLGDPRRSRRGRTTAVVATALALAAGALLSTAPAQATSSAGAPPAATGPAPTAAGTTAEGAVAEGRGTSFRPDTQLASWQLYQDLYLTDHDDDLAVATNPASCSVPATTLAFRQGVFRRINYFRAMAGVPDDIVPNADYNALAQRVSLMIAANRSISHNPPSSWRCYTAAGGAAANKSNLWISRYGADAVTGWIEDPGSANTPAGHRRWVLHPPTRQMGVGSVRGPSGDPFSTGAALYVQDPNVFGTMPALRDGFVAWPPPGFVPDTVVFPRFSFGIPNANFATATVTVTRNGSPVSVTRHTPANGYGINTLVFEVPSANHRPAEYHVTIGRVSGAPRSLYEYDITVFDPDVPPEPVTLTTPANEAEYGRGRTVAADYSCQMPSQVSCVGTVADGAPIDTATLGARSFTVTATDSAGAQRSVTHRYTVVDKTKPSISITSPVAGASFVQGQAVTADYGCSDDVGGSGIASCLGTVADGAALPTGTLGASRPFSVSATDTAGNTRAVDQPYAVTQRPDALIGVTAGPAPVGDQLYSPTATPPQAVSASVSRGARGSFDVTVQNDAGATASFLLKSTVTDGTGFRVSYRDAAGADITSAVNAGTYSTGDLAPGQAVTVTLRVKARSTAVLGAMVKVDLAARNGAGPFVRDVVRARVTAAAPAS